MKNLPRLLTLIGCILIVFSLDRATKIWAEVNLLAEDINLWGKWFRFKLEYNDSLALSIPFPLAGQIFLSLVFLIILIWYFRKKHPSVGAWEKMCIVLIFGGALGNLADRIIFGRVVDFIAVWQFPVFNLADTFLFLGVCFFVGKEVLLQKADNVKL